ncbi:hypothetical protein GCM10009753_02050 [Streptantibioticus ferralitis]
MDLASRLPTASESSTAASASKPPAHAGAAPPGGRDHRDIRQPFDDHLRTCQEMGDHTQVGRVAEFDLSRGRERPTGIPAHDIP